MSYKHASPEESFSRKPMGVTQKYSKATPHNVDAFCQSSVYRSKGIPSSYGGGGQMDIQG